jgi:hypothetical protein
VFLSFAHPPAVVMLRDGVDGAWQSVEIPPEPTDRDPAIAATVRFEVNGPYMVTVVCEQSGSWRTWQVARTPEDSRSLTAPCDPPVREGAITGHMVHAGHVHVGAASVHSDVADWDVRLSAPLGVRDLIANTDAGMAVRRGLQLTGALALDKPIDVVKEGTALIALGFVVENAKLDETLAAAVEITTVNSTTGRIYEGPLASVKIASDAALIESDTQSVSLEATRAGARRTLRRPFQLGDDTVYTLPPTMGEPQWSLDGDRLSVDMPELPEVDNVLVSAAGSTGEGTQLASYELDLSSAYLRTVQPTTAVIDIDIPGYEPEWKIDFTKNYSRQLQTHSIRDAEVETSSITERVEHSSAGAK